MRALQGQVQIQFGHAIDTCRDLISAGECMQLWLFFTISNGIQL
jgi:hypothetical protein